jgi:hypothetical protein
MDFYLHNTYAHIRTHARARIFNNQTLLRSSRMWRHAASKIDAIASEETAASIFRAEDEGTTFF